MKKVLINGVKKTEEQVINEVLFISLEQYDFKFERLGRKTSLKVYNHGEKQYGRYLFEVKDMGKVVSIIQDGHDFFVELNNKMIIPHLCDDKYVAGKGIKDSDNEYAQKLKKAYLENMGKKEEPKIPKADSVKINKRYIVKFFKNNTYVLFDSNLKLAAGLYEYDYLYSFPMKFANRKFLIFEKNTVDRNERFGLFDAENNREYYIAEATFRKILLRDTKTIAYIYFDINSHLMNSDNRFKYKKITGIKDLPVKDYLEDSVYLKDTATEPLKHYGNLSPEEKYERRKQKEINKRKTKAAGIAKGTKNARHMVEVQIERDRLEQSKALEEKRKIKEPVPILLDKESFEDYTFVYDQNKYLIINVAEKNREGREIIKTKVYENKTGKLTVKDIEAYDIQPSFEISSCRGLIQYGPTHFYVQIYGNHFGYGSDLAEKICYLETRECTSAVGSYGSISHQTNKVNFWAYTIPGCIVGEKYNFITRPMHYQMSSAGNPLQKRYIDDMDEDEFIDSRFPKIEDMVIDSNYLLISERGIYDIANGVFIDYFSQYERLLFAGNYLTHVYDEPHPIVYAQLLSDDPNATTSYEPTMPFIEIDALTGDPLSGEIKAEEVFPKIEQYKAKRDKVMAKELKNKPKK